MKHFLAALFAIGMAAYGWWLLHVFGFRPILDASFASIVIGGVILIYWIFGTFDESGRRETSRRHRPRAWFDI
jgi:hypothetical protein